MVLVMRDACRDLRQYLRYGHHECVATTIDVEGVYNSAPMGVELFNDSIILKPYISTRTYSNIVSVGEVLLNITNDSLIYYYALFKPERIKYGKSRHIRPPRILGSIDLYVETMVISMDKIDESVAKVSLRPICCYEGSGSKLAFSRANSLLVEALIHYTKLPPLINDGKFDEVKHRYEAIKEVYDVVLRLGSKDINEAVEEILLKSSDLVRSGGINASLI